MTEPFHHPQSLRIFGPAGSGKTRALIGLLTEHVDDGDFNLRDGIIVSFTRAAAQDIARRVNPDSEPGRYHCTIHALCKRYYGFDGEIAELKLRQFFAERRIPFSGRASADPDEWASAPDEQRSEGSLLAAFWNLCRNCQLPISEGKRLWAPEPEVAAWWLDDRIERLFADYTRWKQDHDLTDFTDMLEYAAANPPSAVWPFFVLDEAQDCTPLQWSVVQTFASRCEVAYVAGDDDQAIYQWAGATPREFLHARVSADDVLSVNHRSAAAIVEASQAFIRQNRERRDKGTTATRGGGSIETLPTGILPSLNLEESTFVMARGHYFNAALMERMTEDGVPFVDRRGKYGVSGTAASAYQRFMALARGRAVSLDELRLLFDAIPSAQWLVRGAKTRLMKIAKPERLSTLVRLRDLGDYGATDDLAGAVRKGDIGVLACIDQARLGYLRRVEANHGPEFLDERRAAAVCQAGSIHAFKGLECDTVILHDGWPMRAAVETRRDPEPERRVAYVAMTRAKSRLVHYNAGARPFATWQALL